MKSRPATNAELFRHMPCMCGALRTATRAVTRLYDRELGAAGLRGTQFSILNILSTLGPMRQSALAKFLAAEKTTMSRNLRLVEVRGWVSLAEGDDRRERIVALTAKGRARLDGALRSWERAQQKLRQSLGEDGWHVLRELLPRVADAALRA